MNPIKSTLLLAVLSWTSITLTNSASKTSYEAVLKETPEGKYAIQLKAADKGEVIAEAVCDTPLFWQQQVRDLAVALGC